MHSDILNYTKLAFNSFKMIQNDTVNQTGDDRPLTRIEEFLNLPFVIFYFTIIFQYTCMPTYWVEYLRLIFFLNVKIAVIIFENSVIMSTKLLDGT